MYEPADGFDDGEFIIIDNWEIGMIIFEAKDENEQIPFVIIVSEEAIVQKLPYHEVAGQHKSESITSQEAIIAFKSRMNKAYLSKTNIDEIRELINYMRRFRSLEQKLDQKNQVSAETY